METLTVQALADICLASLAQVATNPVILRAVARQQKRQPHAVVPLLSLGTEWRTEQLWEVVVALDERLRGLSFAPDNPDDVRLLEGALDGVSHQITEVLHQVVRQCCPGVSLGHGLVEGEWAIYAVVPRGVRLAPEEPIQGAPRGHLREKQVAAGPTLWDLSG